MSKRPPKVVRRSRRKKSEMKVSASEKSFGSILDDVGFQPSGKRILVSKTREHETQSDARKTSMPPGVVQSSPIDDPLGFDTSDPLWHRKVARNALSGADRDAIRREVRSAMRRWKLTRRRP